MSQVVIVDYGLGNIQSVVSATEYLGCDTLVSSKPKDIELAGTLILPGVGAFAQGMENLRQSSLIDALHKAVILNKTPILGICLGMQLFAEMSEEKGEHEGLGWIPGTVRYLRPVGELPVPHVGWSPLSIQRKAPLFDRIHDVAHMFFDHSLSLVCDEKFISARCDYGQDVIAAVVKGNILGVQFHPEKSQKNGLRLLRAFLNWAVQQEVQGRA
jgi:glutamine amidotransferase